jgi:hypothetical protein
MKPARIAKKFSRECRYTRAPRACIVYANPKRKQKVEMTNRRRSIKGMRRILRAAAHCKCGGLGVRRRIVLVLLLELVLE